MAPGQGAQTERWYCGGTRTSPPSARAARRAQKGSPSSSRPEQHGIGLTVGEGELAAVDADLSCSEVELPVTKSTTTHHFRVLRENGVIRQTYQGTAKMNGLRREDLDALFPGLLDRVLEAADSQEHRLTDG